MSYAMYLKERLSAGTAKRYEYERTKYVHWLSQKNIKINEANYDVIIQYLEELRSRYKNPQNIQVSLSAIKKYHEYLMTTKELSGNPARYIRLRDATTREVQLQDLFSEEELENLLNKKYRFKASERKNNLIISLLIDQGLTAGEIIRLTINDINLEQGKINIRGSRRLNGRTLDLKPRQILLLHQYIAVDRKALLKNADEVKQLIITLRGTPEKGEGVSYLIDTLKKIYPERKLNAKTIRQSVIANKLKSGIDLRLVQYFAGHKYPSSTERYRQIGIEALKAGIQKYHPLK